MKKFLLLLHEDMQTMEKLSPKEMEELINAHFAWVEKLKSDGNFISGDGLESTATFIMGKECIIKDGPFLETKEIIGGYYLLQAASKKEMLAIAMECPGHLWGGTTEIRPIADYES
ncbi:YciI family protein [Galbibacter pacificus]|uniref:YciI family protein n=1 Tax=Galbibacter pacificus TaxID=2996052 RepID=A0ABT6FUJ7_9FLAO|nr:YciI family protein [Galbibacter pacificus]MDG3583587.1 YciI family protein [Galbibacter pacificus]MDG3586937.1 YciI family protein [Galbibacter pacificus]